MKRYKLLGVWVAGAMMVLGAVASWAAVTSDRAAAILVFPRVLANRITQNAGVTTALQEVDTVIQITNTSNDPVSLHCFYVNANSHCSLSGGACGGIGFGCPLAQDLCVPGWTETDFDLTLTGQQPIAWRASQGLSRDGFPLDGIAFQGPGGQSNSGSAVPPVSAEQLAVGVGPGVESATIFFGELRCVVVDSANQAIPRNVIKGEATLETLLEIGAGGAFQRVPIVEKYSAIGIPAVGGDVDGDGVLVLGGDAGEYEGCPNVLIMDHFFDGAVGVAFGQVFSQLTLVPCAEDLRRQVPGSVTAQFLVFNEFEQRFSTSSKVDCYFQEFLSLIDTPNSDRSIFNAAVAGTMSGQTRIRGVQGGLLGVLSEISQASPLSISAMGLDDASNLHVQGDRANPDLMILP